LTKLISMDEGKNMLALINSRQSDRSYSDKAVEKEKLERIEVISYNKY